MGWKVLEYWLQGGNLPTAMAHVERTTLGLITSTEEKPMRDLIQCPNDVKIFKQHEPILLQELEAWKKLYPLESDPNCDGTGREYWKCLLACMCLHGDIHNWTVNNEEIYFTYWFLPLRECSAELWTVPWKDANTHKRLGELVNHFLGTIPTEKGPLMW
jgi:hypothetical protein